MNRENVVGHNIWQPLLVGMLSWALPGVGYIVKGRVLRGLVIGGVVFGMFVVGILFGGHLFDMHNSAEVGLLAYVYGFCDLGMGLTYFICLGAGIGVLDQAQRASSEYGNIFLIVAGLLNFLAVLDSFDIALGRKH